MRFFKWYSEYVALIVYRTYLPEQVVGPLLCTVRIYLSKL